MTTWYDIAPNLIDDGPIIQEAVFNYVSVAEAMDSLAERTGFWWRIDELRRLYFVERVAFTAPWIATAADMREGTATVDHSNPKYRNTQVIKGPRDLTSPQTEIQLGDGEKQTFVVGYPIAKVPTVRVDTGTGFDPQEMGIKGIDEGKDWYWKAGDPSITQELSDPPLGATDEIEITYQGEFPILILSKDDAAIIERQSIEGIGTGIVENVRDEPQQSTRQSAFQLAAQLLDKYGTIGRKLQFTTRRVGLSPGHLLTVNYPEYGLNGTEMLVEAVSVVDEQASAVWYQIIAVEGPEMHSWAQVFADILKVAQASVRVGTGEADIVIIPYNFSKTWTDIERPNIFLEKYPAVGRTWAAYTGDTWTDIGGTETWWEMAFDGLGEPYPSANTYPMFNPAERVLYMIWQNAVEDELGRKQITQQTGLTTDEIESTTFMAPAEGLEEDISYLGWIGGFRATIAAGTGIIIDQQPHPDAPKTKTSLEAWQVKKTDTKGW